MQNEQIGTVVALVIAFIVALVLVMAMRAARRRRRAEFADEEARDRVEAREHPEEARELEREALIAEVPEQVPEEGPEAPDVPPSATVEDRRPTGEDRGPSTENRDPTTEAPVAEKPVEVPRLVPEKPVEDAAITEGLAKTRSSFMGRLNQLFSRGPKVDPAVLDELEEVLLTADVGVALTTKLVDEIRADLKSKKLESVESVREALKARMFEALSRAGGAGDPLAVDGARPRIILFVGVNGVGKTTTIGKVAQQLHERGKNVVLAAGDTFRAAAAEQLSVWADRTQSKIIRGQEGADPASVIFNSVEHAKQTSADIVLADTAGRLHTKTELMDEIKKVKRACGKSRDGAPDETWLVVDATTGQNALQQAREFHQALTLSGVILTKLDGTAKGGVVVAIADALQIPVRFIGVGEKAADLRPFNPRTFVDALFRAA